MSKAHFSFPGDALQKPFNFWHSWGYMDSYVMFPPQIQHP